MLHRRDGARIPPDVKLGIQAKEFNLSFIRPDNIYVPFDKLQAVCHVPFTEASVWALHHEGGRNFQKDNHLQRGTLELCQSDHRVLPHFPDQGPNPPIAQFAQAASSMKSWWFQTYSI